ncbi:MAG: ATP-binding cassette domain-containing protein, partial [Oscillospiraceae bacterium]|nr:ATP-binding cassette domain-containing protein [Oscillospiraceae bacterium]
MDNNTLIKVEHLTKRFTINSAKGFKKQSFAAVSDVSLEIKRGEVFGLVGESGCGKSTMSLLLLKLLEATSGKIWFDGTDITKFGASKMRPIR